MQQSGQSPLGSRHECPPQVDERVNMNAHHMNDEEVMYVLYVYTYICLYSSFRLNSVFTVLQSFNFFLNNEENLHFEKPKSLFFQSLQLFAIFNMLKFMKFSQNIFCKKGNILIRFRFMAPDYADGIASPRTSLSGLTMHIAEG